MFRLYLQPGDASTSGASTAAAPNLLDESKLAAWTAIPLALTAGSQASRRSRQSGGNQGGGLRLNVGSHNLPLFFPPVVPVPNIPLRGPFPDQWLPYGQASLRVSIFATGSLPPARPSSPEEFQEENDLPKDVWIKNGRSSILTDEFDDGNGFDLYIDGARFLPDSVSITKVAGRVLDKNYTRIGADIDVQATLDSDIYNPEYNYRTEYRDPVFPQSCTLMLKVYTVDRISKTLCCVGYGFLPIFVEVGTTKQPSVSSGNAKVAFNEGPHQIRLYGGSPDLSQPLHESVTQSVSPVPCASLLVRLVQAARHPNGRPKEASEFSESERESEGLLDPKPSYADGAYYSLSCEPTLGECQIFHSMVNRQPVKTREAIKLIGDGQENKLKKDRVIETWIKISVDAAQNLPWSNFTLVSYCLSPPASFYRGAREDSLNHVTKAVFSSSVASPVWKDGLKAWTAVQVFDEGYVMNGCYQLPLYYGDPPEAVLNSLESDNCHNVLGNFRRRKAIKLLEGSSVYVRLSDARRAEELPAPKMKAIQDYLPKERIEKYLNVNPSSSLSSLVPRGVTEDELRMELKDKFVNLTNQLLGGYQKDTS
ncbi:hypothetical protein AWC38_SpisGene5082 [Stylophora pistillata]|uniref:Uncharacterized protein n=1 Tax=Stylophora pistillata TaxID=50429 RepID=A0A2B4SJN5_STYPI|nr:hypothetical protein AWC38_SpisGene5082 [Stylophora pistillata]